MARLPHKKITAFSPPSSLFAPSLGRCPYLFLWAGVTWRCMRHRFLNVCPVSSIPMRCALIVSDTKYDRPQEPVELFRFGPVMCNHVMSSRHAPAASQAEIRASVREGKATHHLHSMGASWPSQLFQAVCYIGSPIVALLPGPRR